MTDLKIRVYKRGEAEPEATVTIPGGVLKVASKLVPKKTAAALQEKGVDLDELIKLAANPEVRGTIVEIEDHKDNEKVVISLE